MSVNAGNDFNQGPTESNEIEDVNSGTIETPVIETPESTATGRNPNWNEFYEALPDDMLRNKITPILETYDRNNNSRFEKVQQQYSPYKELVDNEVPFEDIKLAFQLRQEIMDSPQVIFERLAQHLQSQGINIAEVLKLEDQGQGLENQDDFEDEIDPRLTAIQNQQQQLVSFLANKEAEEQQRQEQYRQEQQEADWKEQTLSTLDSLETKYGKFDRNKLVSYAVMESNQTGKIDLEQSLISMREFAQETVKGLGSFNAPNVFSGTGSMPSGRIDTKGMTDEQVNAYVAARAKAMNGG